MQNEISWDKLLTLKLIERGLSHKLAREAIGVFCEHRESAYRDGYCRGFNQGYEQRKKKDTRHKRD